jgi:hypothetical protein
MYVTILLYEISKFSRWCNCGLCAYGFWRHVLQEVTNVSEESNVFILNREDSGETSLRKVS